MMPSFLQMEYCDRGCLGAAIKRGAFRAVEGRWGRDTALRCLVRTAKEMAQVSGKEGNWLLLARASAIC